MTPKQPVVAVCLPVSHNVCLSARLTVCSTCNKGAPCVCISADTVINVREFLHSLCQSEDDHVDSLLAVVVCGVAEMACQPDDRGLLYFVR